MNFDDVEQLLEGVLVGLKGRKEFDSLRQKIAALEATNEALTNERDEVSRQLSDAQKKISDMTIENDNLREKISSLDIELDFLKDERVEQECLRADFTRTFSART